MKTLQNNFTTKEQSKQLLKMGLPANSADCYHNDIACRPFTIPQGTLFSDPRNMFTKETLPCWSVGRLMEINRMCNTASGQWNLYSNADTRTLVEWMMDVFENSQYDFSKLED